MLCIVCMCVCMPLAQPVHLNLRHYGASLGVPMPASLWLAGVSGRNAGVEEGAVAMKTKYPLQCPALSSTVAFLSLYHAPGQLGVAGRAASLVTD